MKDKKISPDFDCWSKMDVWKFKDAAMLFQHIDPLEYTKINFNTSPKNLPHELHEAYKVYLIFQNYYWDFRFTPQANNYAHPFDIILHAQKKGITIPPELLKLISLRMNRELQDESPLQIIDEKHKEVSSDELTTRERNNLLKTIGILTSLLVAEKNIPLFQRGSKPNAFQIAQMIIEKAQAHNINIEGLKSIDRKISEAFKLLEEDAAGIL